MPNAQATAMRLIASENGNPIEVSAEVATKAHRLLEEGRVAVPTQRPDTAVVVGFSGVHVVRAWRRGVSCSCPAGRLMGVRCAHALAAMVIWKEREDRLDAALHRDAQATDGCVAS